MTRILIRRRLPPTQYRWEDAELDRHLNLASIDKELHDAYNCTAEAFEVRSLHRYPTLMWCSDAQVHTHNSSRPISSV